MAVGARQVAAMVLGFVGQRHMTIVRRCPRAGDVAGIAFLDGTEVIRVWAGRFNTIVTGRTGTQYLVVIDGDYRCPGRAAVTIFTNTRRLYVLRSLSGRNRAIVAAYAIARGICVIEVRRRPGDGRMAIVAIAATCDMRRMLAGSDDAVMTGRTTAEYLCVIDRYHGCPDCGAVAILANVRGLNVLRTLTGCISTVVAGHAAARDVGVVEIRRYPRDGGVAVVAAIAARDVQRVFASRSDAVMTGAATAQNLRMIDGDYGRPDGPTMAVLADVCCLNMHRSFASCFRTVMAAHAIANDVRVIEVRRSPGDSSVAIVAVIAARDMRRIFPFCGEAVMTGAATSQHLRVVYRKHRLPRRRAVAIFANSRRLDMSWTLSACSNAVVAANAITENVAVIEDSGYPRDRVVAIVALIAGRNVRRRLSGRLKAVVASDATACYGRVIHKGDCAPTRGDMTIRALSGCHDMIGGF